MVNKINERTEQGKIQNLGGENNGTTGFLDLLLGYLRDELGLHDDWLRGRQRALAQNLEVAELSDVDERGVIRRGFVLHILRHHGPQLVNVDDGAVELVAELVEVPHSDLPEVARVVLVEKDAVVMHTSSISATTGVLPVLADPAMAGADVPSLLPVLLEPGCHPCTLYRLRPLNPWGCLRREEKEERDARVLGIYRNAVPFVWRCNDVVWLWQYWSYVVSFCRSRTQHEVV